MHVANSSKLTRGQYSILLTLMVRESQLVVRLGHSSRTDAMAALWFRQVACGNEWNVLETLSTWNYDHGVSHTDLTMSHGCYPPRPLLPIRRVSLGTCPIEISGMLGLSHQDPRKDT